MTAKTETSVSKSRFATHPHSRALTKAAAATAIAGTGWLDLATAQAKLDAIPDAHSAQTEGASRPTHPHRRPRRFARADYQRSPDRERSIRRRKTLAGTRPLPPALAAQLTFAQLAYARLISDDYVAHGQCDRCLDEIGARTGVCSKTAQRAQDRLAELKLIHVRHRERPGQKHETNVITIISPEWKAWIEMAPARNKTSREVLDDAKRPLPSTEGIGGQKRPATETNLFLRRVTQEFEGVLNIKTAIRSAYDFYGGAGRR